VDYTLEVYGAIVGREWFRELSSNHGIFFGREAFRSGLHRVGGPGDFICGRRERLAPDHSAVTSRSRLLFDFPFSGHRARTMEREASGTA